MVVPENRQHPLKLRMTMTLFKVLVSLLIVLTIVFVIGVVMGGQYLRVTYENRTLLAENQNLRKQLGKIESIEIKLAQIQEMETFLRRILDSKTEETPAPAEPTIIDFGRSYFTAKAIPTARERSRYIPYGLPQSGAVTSMHGARNPLFDEPHAGIDIALPPGRAVYATAAGRVVFADYTRDLGFLVEIDHTNGYTTRYGHLAKTIVNKNDFIDRNSILGFSGATGKAIGTHIHYEVLKDGENIDPLETHRIIEGDNNEETGTG